MHLLESQVERRCRDIAELAGCKLLKIQGVRGWPDRLLICPGGKSMFIEFKREGEKLRPLQELILADLRALGHLAEMINNPDAFLRYLNHLLPLSGSPTDTKPEA